MINMTRQFIFLNTILVFAFSAIAQVSLVHGDSLHVDTCVTASQDIAVDNYIYNSSGATVSVDFYAYVTTKESSWIYSFCNNSNCFPLTSGYWHGTFNISSLDQVWVHTILSAYGQAGFGNVKVVFVTSTDSLVANYSDSVCVTSDIVENSGLLNLSFGPNPVVDELHIKFPADLTNVKAEVYNILGVKQSELFNKKSNELTLDLRTLKQGLYLLRVTDIKTGKVITNTFKKA